MNNLYKEIVIDGGKLSHSSGRFRGLGAVLDGKSSRILEDYKFKNQKSYQEIIELLFRKKYGAALSHIKIECDLSDISSDSNSYRHFGFEIASDALNINSDISIELFFTDNGIIDYTEKYSIYKNILNTAYQNYSIKADYVSVGNGSDSGWIEYLSGRLKNDKTSKYDFSSIKIAVSDSFSDEMAVNENLRKSADIIFGGNVLSDSTIMLNKKFQKEIWNSEGAAPCCISKYAVNADGSGISGENSLIEVTGRINGIFNAGSTIYEYKSVLSVCEGENPWGRIISADKPWSGYFSIGCGLWGAAHFTHFAEKNWKVISSGNGEEAGDYSVFVSEKGDYSAVFANNSDKPKKYSICVRNIEKADAFIHCVETKGPESCDNYSVNWFRLVDKIIPVKKNYGFVYTLEVKPFSIMTCTTLSVEHVNGIYTVRKPECENTVLNLPYFDSFNYGDELLKSRKNIPLYTLDLCGRFEILSDGEENTLIQIAEPDDNRDKIFPVTVLGDDSWSDYSVKIEVKLSDEDILNYAGAGLRYQMSGDTAECGYQLRIYSDSRWQLRYMDNILEEGMADNIIPNEWNSIKISACGRRIKCCINKVLVCEHVVSAPFVLSGKVSICSGYSRNMFRNLVINPVLGAFEYSIMHDCLNGEFVYSGSWVKNSMDSCEFNNRTSVSTETPNSYFEFDFIGESVAFAGKAENLRLKVEIDDKIMAAGIFIGNCGEKEIFYSRSNMENTSHKLKLIVLSGRLEFNNAQTFISGHHILPKTLINGSSIKKAENGKTLKKSTLLMGAGLAAAGTGLILLKKALKKGKNKK